MALTLTPADIPSSTSFSDRAEIPDDLSGLTLVTGAMLSGKTRLLHDIAACYDGRVEAFLPKLGAEYETWPDLAGQDNITVHLVPHHGHNVDRMTPDIVTGILNRAASGSLVIVDEAWLIGAACFMAVMEALERNVNVVLSSIRRSDLDLYTVLASRIVVCERV